MGKNMPYQIWVVFIFLIVFSGCASLEWQLVKYEDTPRAYEFFLRTYPGSKHAQEARDALAGINPGKKRYLKIPPNSKILINELEPTWNFKGGEVYILPKEKIKFRFIKNQRGIYYTGILKGWDNGKDAEYLNEIKCPLSLLISYGSGAWSRVEVDDDARIVLRNGKIEIAGTIDLRKSKSYHSQKNSNINNAILIYDSLYNVNTNCSGLTKGHYKLTGVDNYGYYLVKAPESTATEAIVNISENWPLFCSQDEVEK